MTTTSRLIWLIDAALKVFVALLPALIVVALLHFRYGTNIYEHVPVLNDEVNYWHQAATFAAVGFEGGYYAPYESPARANWTRFGTHGPWYPMLYGTLGRLLGGWELYTPVIINLLLYTLAIAIFIHTVNPNRAQLLALGLVLATIHPVLLYLPTGMSEAMHAAIAMLLAAIFWRLLHERGQVKPWQMIGYGAFLWLVTVTRLSWGILLLPFFLLAFPFKVRGVLLALLMTGLSAGLAYMVALSVTPAQSIHSVFDTLDAFSFSLEGGLQTLTNRLAANWNRYINPNKRPADVLLTQQLMAMGGLLSVSLALKKIIGVLRKTSQTADALHLVFNLYNLTTVLGSSLSLYIMATFGDYRVIGIHLLMTLLLLITFRHYFSVLIFVVMTLLNLPMIAADADTHRFFGTVRFTTLSAIQTIHIPEQIMAYYPNATSPWCNTLMMEIPLYTADAARVPAGIGLSWVYGLSDINPPVQSRYVWLTDESIEQARAESLGLELTPLFDMPQGIIYLNEASACPS